MGIPLYRVIGEVWSYTYYSVCSYNERNLLQIAWAWLWWDSIVPWKQFVEYSSLNRINMFKFIINIIIFIFCNSEAGNMGIIAGEVCEFNRMGSAGKIKAKQMYLFNWIVSNKLIAFTLRHNLQSISNCYWGSFSALTCVASLL